jgi:hypothetical protein
MAAPLYPGPPARPMGPKPPGGGKPPAPGPAIAPDGTRTRAEIAAASRHRSGVKRAHPPPGQERGSRDVPRQSEFSVPARG